MIFLYDLLNSCFYSVVEVTYLKMKLGDVLEMTYLKMKLGDVLEVTYLK